MTALRGDGSERFLRRAALHGLFPIEAGAAYAYGSAGASNPCCDARFLNQA